MQDCSKTQNRGTVGGNAGKTVENPEKNIDNPLWVKYDTTIMHIGTIMKWRESLEYPASVGHRVRRLSDQRGHFRYASLCAACQYHRHAAFAFAADPEGDQERADPFRL